LAAESGRRAGSTRLKRPLAAEPDLRREGMGSVCGVGAGFCGLALTLEE
jgi:hypothetical protein